MLGAVPFGDLDVMEFAISGGHKVKSIVACGYTTYLYFFIGVYEAVAVELFKAPCASYEPSLNLFFILFLQTLFLSFLSLPIIEFFDDFTLYCD